MRALEVARRQYASIVAGLRIRQALRSRTVSAADLFINRGDRFRVFRETFKRISGPYTVIAVSQKQVSIDRVGTVSKQNFPKVIPYSTYTRATELHLINTTLRSSTPKPPPEQSPPMPVYITKHVHSSGPRLLLNVFHTARLRELSGLEQRDTCLIMDAS